VIIEYKRKICLLRFSLLVNLNSLHTELCQPCSEISIMSKRRMIKNKLQSERQDFSKRSLQVVKSKKFTQSASSNVFQSIEITQLLSSNEVTMISALRSHLQKIKKVVIISDAEIFMNADSEFLIIASISASLMMISKFLIFKSYESQCKLLLIYLSTTRRSTLIAFTR